MDLPNVSAQLQIFSNQNKQASAALMAETIMYHLAFIADFMKSSPDGHPDLNDEMILKICIMDNFAKEIVDFLSMGSTVASITQT